MTKTSLTWPGTFIAASGVIVFFGIFLGEHYFHGYNARINTISDLGQKTSPLNSTNTSLLIFNSAMVIAGICTIIGALSLRSTLNNNFVTIALLIHGIAIAGVGIFPSTLGGVHFVFALLTFTSAEFVAIASFFSTQSNVRFLFLVLGCVSVIALLANGYLKTALGVGAAERWIVYPTTIWLIAYGIYLLNTSHS